VRRFFIIIPHYYHKYKSCFLTENVI